MTLGMLDEQTTSERQTEPSGNSKLNLSKARLDKVIFENINATQKEAHENEQSSMGRAHSRLTGTESPRNLQRRQV